MTEVDPTTLAANHDHDADYDRAAAMFPEGAPDVGIAFLNVHRQTLTELGPNSNGGTGEDRGKPERAEVHWHVYGMPSVSSDPARPSAFTLYGDLSVRDGNWFLAVTTAVSLVWRDRGLPIEPSDTTEVNALSRTLGAWASTLLYDLASISGRQLVASSFYCDLVVPMLTPKAHIAVVHHHEDDESHAHESGKTADAS